VPPPAGSKPLFSYTVANGYRDFVTNERLLADLRKRFESRDRPDPQRRRVVALRPGAVRLRPVLDFLHGAIL
jgi:hypothetical protein